MRYRLSRSRISRSSLVSVPSDQQQRGVDEHRHRRNDQQRLLAQQPDHAAHDAEATTGRQKISPKGSVVMCLRTL